MSNYQRSFKINILITVLAVLSFLILVLCLPARAQLPDVNWKVTNQATVAWDAPTNTIDEEPISSEFTIKYELFVVNAVTDPNKTNPALVTPTPIIETTSTLSFPDPGFFILGVRAVKYLGDNRITHSEMAWSDDPVATNNVVFGVVQDIAPKKPLNLRRVN